MERIIDNEWGQDKVYKIQLREKATSKTLILLFPMSDSFLSLYLSGFHYVNKWTSSTMHIGTVLASQEISQIWWNSKYE